MLMDINTNTYMVTATTAGTDKATLTTTDTKIENVLVANLGSVPVFVVSGLTGLTITYPTSASVPLRGKIVPAGAVYAVKKSPSHGYIYAITASGSAAIALSIGEGE